MPTPAHLFRLLNEFVFLLLGGLLILLAITGRFAAPGRSAAWIALGVVFLYWGVRAWARPQRAATRWQASVRSGSLVLVGGLVLLIAVLPVRFAASLLVLAGAVLALRGLVSAVLLVRAP